MKIRVGSRKSRLAVIQAEMVMDAIRDHDGSLETELITMTTTGDRILDRNLDKVGGKGLFVKELEIALAEGRVDITVHSLKDMTMEMPEDYPILAVSRREDPRDALVLPRGTKELDLSKPIGCSSARRIIQFSKLFPDARFEPIRGNIQTRLEKVDSGMYAGTLFAVAGLKRAGLQDRISRIFEPEEMIPAAGQGILAVQGAKDADVSWLGDFHDPEAWRQALCERSFVRTLDGGCSSPIAAYAEIKGENILLTGLNVDESGESFVDMLESVCRSDEDCEELGRALAMRMKQQLVLKG